MVAVVLNTPDMDVRYVSYVCKPFNAPVVAQNDSCTPSTGPHDGSAEPWVALYSCTDSVKYGPHVCVSHVAVEPARFSW